LKTQWRELMFRCIAYNVHRMINVIIARWFLQSRYFQLQKLTIRAYPKIILL
jgi:hypothetical protein